MSHEEVTAKFEEVWRTGPWRKLEKQTALKRFKSSVKTEADFAELQTACRNYAAYCSANAEWYHPKMGSTFFSKWKEWAIIEEKPAARPEPIAHDLVHQCELCAEPHVWTCLDVNPVCTLDRIAPCYQWIANWKARQGRG